MTIKAWALNEVVTDINMNEMVNDIGESILYTASPHDLHFRGLTTSAAYVQVGSLDLVPVQARYICLRLQAKVDAAQTGKFKITIVVGGVEEELYKNEAVVSTTYVDYTAVVDLQGLAVLGDITGGDAAIRLYLNDKCYARNVMIFGGQSSANADYGG